ncbi:MAG: hypothetical protein C0613_14380 [Desulfobulbaceae bacterium]|nr:MAG: hypothetical protein C0613_14380 [Desulfobulbaceae bacterium]
MTNTIENRIDEVAQYYEPAVKFEKLAAWLFWLISILSLCMPYYSNFGELVKCSLQSSFIVSVILYFSISQISRFYLVPKAERMRRKQMLSDAFGTPLCHDKTSLYYNNDYTPSLQRLGANTMENSFFSKEVAEKMLHKKRTFTGGYAVIWLLAFSLRHNNLEILTWITQVIFSGEIIAQWLNLEVLRLRHERTYDRLHTHFLHDIGAESPRAIATVLDSFVAYESAKSSAGLLLSTKVFNELNSSLTKKWTQIRKELKMEFQPSA